MKKVLSIIVVIAMLSSLMVGLGFGGIKPVKAAGATWYVSASGGSDSNSGTSSSEAFKTITKATNAASDGDTIQVANGAYTEQLNVNKEVSIIGESEAGVIIDISSFSSGYGMTVAADNVTLKNFTLKNAPSYGIHSSGATNLDFENITMENCVRSGIDFNGCSSIILKNIVAQNNGGVGIALTDSNDATVSNITTSGNAWSGIAVFTSGQYHTGGSSDITLSGANSFGELVPFYVETAHYGGGTDYPVTNLNVSNDFAYMVRAPVTNPHDISFYSDLNTALNAAKAAVTTYHFNDVVVNNIASISTGGVIAQLPADDYVNYYVGPGMYIQSAVNAAVDNDAVHVMAGTYIEGPQIVINKNLTIIGQDKATTIIKPSADTGSSGDARGWFLVDSGSTLNMANFTLDGAGKQIYQAMRVKGTAVIDNVNFDNIKYSTYLGLGVVLFGGTPGNEVGNCKFTNIGRVGILVFGTGTTALVSNNTYIGKGDGDWLDYGVEVGGGGTVTIDSNIISNCTGVATSDGSTSAALYAETYFGSGTHATIINNTLSNSYAGIGVGYDDNDTSTVVAHYNNILNDTYGVISTAPLVDATYNWWGENDKSGPYHPTLNPNGTGCEVSDNVTFDPWVGKIDNKTEGITEGVAGGILEANSTDTFENGSMGIGADATANGNGSTDVMLVKYSNNPTNSNFNASFNGSYYDLNVTNPENTNKIILKLYYPASHGNLTPFWFDSSTGKWGVCSTWTNVSNAITVGGVSYAGYIAVTINSSTAPSLSELTGTYFALGSQASPIGGTAYPVNKTSIILLWILLLLSVITLGYIVLKKHITVK